VRILVDDCSRQRNIGGNDQIAGLEQLDDTSIGDIESCRDLRESDVRRRRNA
jgi:hypothetical protein